MSCALPSHASPKQRNDGFAELSSANIGLIAHSVLVLLVTKSIIVYSKDPRSRLRQAGCQDKAIFIRMQHRRHCKNGLSQEYRKTRNRRSLGPRDRSNDHSLSLR